MTADRVATWTRPDGVHHHTGGTIDMNDEVVRSNAGLVSRPPMAVAPA